MEKLKFTLFSVVVLALLGLLGYWAIINIQSGSEHSLKQKAQMLQDQNETLKLEVTVLKKELGTLKSELEIPVVAVEEKSKVVEEEPKLTATNQNKYQSLIIELDKLVKENVYMKLKSTGTRVGTVQKFLNIFNNTTNKIDNDYGPTMVKLVTAFQKNQGLPPDGEAGPTAFNKMIYWLEKKGV